MYLVTPVAGALTTAITGAILGPVSWLIEPGDIRNLLLEAIFFRGSGGTTFDAWVQTTLDGGTTWVDIRNFSFTTTSLKQIVNHSCATPITAAVTPTDGGLAANTSVDGIIGDRIRVKATSTGTYGGSSSFSLAASGMRLRAI